MVKSMGAMELSLYLYPRIIPIHNLDDQVISLISDAFRTVSAWLTQLLGRLP